MQQLLGRARGAGRWWPALFALPMIVALANPVSAQSEPSSVGEALQAADDPESVTGTADDPGDAFAGISASADVADAEATARAESSISPEYDPSKTPVDAEAAARPTASAATAAPTFATGEVLGDLAGIEADLAAADTVRVLITSRAPAGAASSDVAARVDALGAIEDALAGTGSKVLYTGTHVPVIAAEISSEGLAAVLDVEATAAVDPDRANELFLSSTNPVTGADVLTEQATRGGGAAFAGKWEVAVLDTGVRTSHNAFSSGGRITDEACYTTDASCPNGSNSQTGAGAGVPNGHWHGTHVAGIAAGNTVGGFAHGIASEAGLIAVNVFDTGGSAAYDSSIISGIDYVVAREAAGNPVAALNLSLGIRNLPFTATCDTFNSSMTTAMAAARAAGILVVVSAGNDGFTGAISYPSCISHAVSIASTTDGDGASGFSNVHPTLADLWAPGSNVTSAYTTSDTAYTTASGTSMAAPQVTGSAAVLSECINWDRAGQAPLGTNDDTVLADLVANGTTVSDGRAGGTASLPRIDLLDTAAIYNANDAFAAPEGLTPASGGTNVDHSHCATEEPSEPFTNGVGSTWYTWTAPTGDPVEFTTCDAQTTADTLIHVYTGSSLSGLTEVASNDQDATCVHSGNHSRLSFTPTAGTTYRVRVSVYAVAEYTNGVYTLSWSQAAAPTCNGLPATIVGTSAGEVINGTPGDDVIVAGAGNDTVNGLGGDDTICLGNGVDQGSGGPGDDYISGGAGDDYIVGGDGADTIRGASGNDEIHGEGDADTLFGDNGHDSLVGGPGDDYLSAHGGADTEDGGPGDDDIYGGPGIDNMHGGPGNDTMGGHGHADQMWGDDGDDILAGHTGEDIMRGNDGADRLYGGPDDDLIRGGAGPDRLIGHGGDDSLYGANGDDYLSGGADNDLCDGGADTDGANITCETLVGIP